MFPACDDLPHALAHFQDIRFALDLLDADLEGGVVGEGVSVIFVGGRRIRDFVKSLEEGHNAWVDGQVGGVGG